MFMHGTHGFSTSRLPIFFVLICIGVILFLMDGCKITSTPLKPKAPLTVSVSEIEVRCSVIGEQNNKGERNAAISITNNGSQSYSGTLDVVSYDINDKEYDKEQLQVTIPPNTTVKKDAWVKVHPDITNIETHWEN